MRDTTNNVVLVGEVMFCKGGRLSVHFCDGEIDVIGNRKQLKRGGTCAHSRTFDKQDLQDGSLSKNTSG